MININSFISTNSQTKTLYKVSQRKMADLSDLEQYIDKDYSIHFSDLPKLGINPQSTYNTPIAVCGYPLTSEIYDQLINKELPFAQEKKYMHLYRIKDAFTIQSYNEGKFQEDLKKILELIKGNLDWQKKLNYDDSVSDEENIEKLLVFGETYYEPKPFSIMWNIGRLLCENARKWNALLRTLGYNAVVDYGSGILYSNEPYQTMVFNPSSIEEVKYYISPIHQAVRAEKKSQKDGARPALKKIQNLKENNNLEELKQEVKNIFDIYSQSDIINLVMENPDNEHLLYVLSFYEDPIIRAEVVLRIKNEEVLKRLLQDPHEDEAVKYYAISKLADNKANTPLIVEYLLYSNDYNNTFLWGSRLENLFKNLNQEEIELLALNATHSHTRDLAIRRLNNVEILKQIMENKSESKDVRDAAKETFYQGIHNQNTLESLFDHPETSEKFKEEVLFLALGNNYVQFDRWNIIEKADKKTILNLFLGPSSKEFDHDIKSEIIAEFSQEEIKNLALNAVHNGTREIAIYCIKDPETLKQIIENESETTYIGYLARERLKSLAQISHNSKINKLSHAVNLFYKTIQAIFKF